MPTTWGENPVLLEQHIIDIMNAHLARKAIQWREKGGSLDWADLPNNYWDFVRYEYRTKPKEPRVRYCVEAPSGKIMTPSFHTLDEARIHQANLGACCIVKFIEVME